MVVRCVDDGVLERSEAEGDAALVAAGDVRTTSGG